MPDAGDEKVADLAADHQPDVVGGDDGADQRAADVDGGQPQRDVGGEYTEPNSSSRVVVYNGKNTPNVFFTLSS